MFVLLIKQNIEGLRSKSQQKINSLLCIFSNTGASTKEVAKYKTD